MIFQIKSWLAKLKINNDIIHFSKVLTLRETINDIWFSSTDIYDDKFEETGTERGILLDEYNIIKIIFFVKVVDPLLIQ